MDSCRYTRTSSTSSRKVLTILTAWCVAWANYRLVQAFSGYGTKRKTDGWRRTKIGPVPRRNGGASSVVKFGEHRTLATVISGRSSRGWADGRLDAHSTGKGYVDHDQGDDEQQQQLVQLLSSLPCLPKLIVFDLDNTLWTPELYQIRQRHLPRVQRDILLFPDARLVLQGLVQFQQHSRGESQNTGTTTTTTTTQKPPFTLAVASRASKTAWAHQLLNDFTLTIRPSSAPSSSSSGGVMTRSLPMREAFSHVLVQTGSKKRHFEELRQATGYSYSDMIFFDDDERMNLREVGQQLGVLSCHTPTGITVPHVMATLRRYAQLRQQQLQQDASKGKEKKIWMGYVLNVDNLQIAEQVAARNLLGAKASSSGGLPSTSSPESGDGGGDRNRRWQGTVKFYSERRRFGFVVAEATDQQGRRRSVEFFLHESNIPLGFKAPQAGDPVTFDVMTDRQGRQTAILVTATTSPNGESSASAPRSSTDTVSLPCFTMSQPFASLLLHGVKTVETRNYDMFPSIPPGTKVLVHCGRKDWRDVESYRHIMLQAKYSEQEIDRLSQLPEGFRRGDVLGVVTIGKTYQPRSRDRQSFALQRQVLAPDDGMGTFCTPVSEPMWLSRGIPSKGQPGLYSVDLPTDCLPVVLTNNTPEEAGPLSAS